MRALDDVSLELFPGERLAIVGENGAGKSTLMNILFGMYPPDSGELQLSGKKVVWGGPGDAMAHGIGMVHQHFMWVPSLTVAENIVLGHEPRHGWNLDLKKACEEIEKTCRSLGFRLDPWAKVETLTVGSQQKVEIVKALHRGAQVLILDEPTAVLTPQETEELFHVTKTLSAQGHSIVFISHKLTEVLAFATRIVVMRRGKKVAETTPEKTTRAELSEWMVGQKTLEVKPRSISVASSLLLHLHDVSAQAQDGRRGIHHISLHIHRGEIVGIAGVDGNGQRELAEVLTGLLPFQQGRVEWENQTLTALTPAFVRKLGISYVPEERHERGMVASLSVEENLSLGRQHLAPFAHRGSIDFASRRKKAEALMAQMDVRPQNPQACMGDLSGGNQQKVVFARALDENPKLLVAVQPTRGLDISAMARLHQALQHHCESGGSVLLISLDLDELLTLSDRLYVLFEGKLQGEFSKATFDPTAIGRRMLGAAT